MAVAVTRKQPVDLRSSHATNFWKSGSEKLLSFSCRHLEKLVGLPGSLPGSLRGFLADVFEETPRVFNCFFLARGVEEGVAAEDLFSLGERAVGDRNLAAGSFVHADSCGAKGHALAFDQPPRLHAVYYELVHGRHLGFCRQAISWIERIYADEAHVHSPRLVFTVTAIMSNGTEANRHETESFFGANHNPRDLHCLHGTPLPPLYQDHLEFRPSPALDVAIQGLVHSIDELCHGTKSPPQV